MTSSCLYVAQFACNLLRGMSAGGRGEYTTTPVSAVFSWREAVVAWGALCLWLRVAPSCWRLGLASWDDACSHPQGAHQ